MPILSLISFVVGVDIDIDAGTVCALAPTTLAILFKLFAAAVLCRLGDTTLLDKLGATALLYKLGANTLLYKLGATTLLYKLGATTFLYKLGATTLREERECQRRSLICKSIVAVSARTICFAVNPFDAPNYALIVVIELLRLGDENFEALG